MLANWQWHWLLQALHLTPQWSHVHDDNDMHTECDRMDMFIMFVDARRSPVVFAWAQPSSTTLRREPREHFIHVDRGNWLALNFAIFSLFCTNVSMRKIELKIYCKNCTVKNIWEHRICQIDISGKQLGIYGSDCTKALCFTNWIYRTPFVLPKHTVRVLVLYLEVELYKPYISIYSYRDSTGKV